MYLDMNIESDEVVGVSQLTRRFRYYLDQLKSRKFSKLVLSRQSNLEAVVLPIKEYENILKAQDELDHLILATELREREKLDTGKRVPWEKIKKKHGLAD